MRYMFYGFLMIVLLLAACDNPPAATEAVPPTEAAAPDNTPDTTENEAVPPAVDDPEATEDPLVAANVVLPLPGTIAPPATQDAMNPASHFSSIIFQQTGGPNNLNLIIEIYRDGRVVRDGVTTSITPDRIAALNTALQAINFFGIQGQFTVPGAGEDVYVYRVTVEQDDGASRMITAQDGYTPPELLEIFATLSTIGG